VAASARANPYAVVSCGLAALDSALHGNVSRLTYRMLASVRAGEPAREVVARAVAAGRGGVPGFGHRIYRAADPRAELIFDLLAELPDAEPAVAAARQVSDVVTAHSNSFRNVDLALATLALATGMPAEAGETIFAHARIAGWIGHALDEYSQPPLRLRPVGRYHGP
jgi:citrate synthase